MNIYYIVKEIITEMMAIVRAFRKMAKIVSNAVSALLTTLFAKNYWKCVKNFKKRLFTTNELRRKFHFLSNKKNFLSEIFYIYSTSNFIHYSVFNKFNVPWTETCIEIQIFQKGYHLWHVYWMHLMKILHAINNIMSDNPQLLKLGKVSKRL